MRPSPDVDVRETLDDVGDVVKSTPGSGGNRVSRAAGRAVAAAAGHAVGGMEGAVLAAAASDTTIDLANAAWTRIQDRVRRGVEDLLDSAADELGLEVHTLLDQALAREATAELLHQAFTAAAETINEQKVDALARALANGLRDDAAHVDQETLIIRALADLDPVHVKLLAVIARERRELEPWIKHETGLTDEVFPPVAGVLQRNSLIDIDTDYAGHFARSASADDGVFLDPAETAWAVTSFGLLAMKRLDPDSR